MKKILFLASTLAAMLAIATMSSCSEDEVNNDKPIEEKTLTISKEILKLAIDGTETLTAKLTPESAETKYEWKSDKAEIASVTEAGMVKALKVGTAKITVTAGGLTKTCEVTVTEKQTDFDLEFERAILSNTKGIDTNNDKKISKDEAHNYNEGIVVNGIKAITSLKGLEYLDQITAFNCAGTGITGELNVSANTELKTLICDNTAITSLELAAKSKLTILNCSNTGINNLGKNFPTLIETLECANTKIGSLDLTNCTNLAELNCSNNANLSTLNLTREKDHLTTLDCSNTTIGSLDLTTCVSLTNLNCSNNANLSTLNLTGKKDNLRILDCFNTKIESLILTSCLSLNELNCSNNGAIKDLDVSNNKELMTLNCSNCALLEGSVATGDGTAILDLIPNAKIVNFDATKTDKLDKIKVWATFPDPVPAWFKVDNESEIIRPD